MRRLLKKYSIIYLSVLLPIYGFAQVGIGTDTPHVDAVLDIQASDKGILIPKVELTSTSNASPITSPKNSLLVYNTQEINDVTPGFYFWSIDKWVSLEDVEDFKDKGLPWFNKATEDYTVTNTNDIYRLGNVSSGTNKVFGKFTVFIDDSFSNPGGFIGKFGSTSSSWASDDAITMNFLRGRGTDYENASTIANGDIVGEINWKSASSGSGDAISYLDAAGIKAVADGTQTATSTPGKLEFWVAPNKDKTIDSKYSNNPGEMELKLTIGSDGRFYFDNNTGWPWSNDSDRVLVIDDNGYFKLTNDNSLRTTPSSNKITYLGNGLYLFDENGTEAHYYNSAIYNSNLVHSKKLIINTQLSEESDYATLSITKKDNELSPLKIDGCQVFDSNKAALKAGLDIGAIYRSPNGKLKIVIEEN